MEVDILEAHDRLQEVHKQGDSIGENCQRIIDSKPFGDHPFYIFAHKREISIDERFDLWMKHMHTWPRLEDVPTHRLIWQPRLTKPKAQTNSMLFKGYPGTDQVKVIWIIPERELWSQFTMEKMTENDTVMQSIYDFSHNRDKLDAKEADDLPDEIIDKIYEQLKKFKPVI